MDYLFLKLNIHPLHEYHVSQSLAKVWYLHIEVLTSEFNIWSVVVERALLFDYIKVLILLHSFQVRKIQLLISPIFLHFSLFFSFLQSLKTRVFYRIKC